MHKSERHSRPGHNVAPLVHADEWVCLRDQRVWGNRLLAPERYVSHRHSKDEYRDENAKLLHGKLLLPGLRPLR